MIIFLWIVLCFVVGYIGDSRKVGFSGGFLWSLVLSPLVGLVIVLVSDKKKTYEEELARLQGTKKSDAANPVAPVIAPGSTIADQIGQLKALLDSGALTQEEYDAAKAKVLSP